MSKLVEKIGIPLFHISGRRKIHNLKKIVIGINGIILNNFKKREVLIKDDESSALFLKNVMSDVDDNKSLIEQNNDIMVACINLGNYVNDNKSIFEDIAYNYLAYKYQEHYSMISQARNLDKIDISNKIYLNKKFRNFELNYDIDFLSQEVTQPKCFKDNKFKRLVLNWFRACGISEKDVFDLRSNHFISIETLLETLDLSLTIYNMYFKYKNNEMDVEETIKVNYHLKGGANGHFDIVKSTDDILSLVLLMMIAYYKNDLSNLRCCEYCNGYFFGRKNKKCCSDRCKDLKNNKYEKRKEKQKRSDPI